jgi:hypothetical protein
MDARPLNVAGGDPAAMLVLANYLSELDSRLPAGRRARRQILDEISDGLACAIEEQMVAGTPAVQATRAALAEFGDPRALAMAFSRQRAPAAAHRLGTGLIFTGPVVGFVWLAAYATTGPDWQSRVASLLSAIPQFPFILAITVPSAMIAVTGAGRASRYIATSRRLATGAALVAATGCVAGDLSLLSATILGRGLASPGPTNLLVVAAIASVIRLNAAGWAGLRIARLRAAEN